MLEYALCIKNGISIVKTFGRYGCFPFVGVIGDVDGDGELDKVAIVASEGELHGQTIDHVRIVKINMFDAIKTRGRYRSRLNMYISEEMRNVHGMKPLEQMDFRPMKEQPWTQYMGKSGDGIYRGID